jgi:hypothetical protein
VYNERLFEYRIGDRISDLWSQNELTVAALGTGQVAGGSALVIGGVIAAPTCATGLGCAAVAGAIALGVDQIGSGIYSISSREPLTTNLYRGLLALGLSPDAALLIETTANTLTGFGAASVATRSGVETAIRSRSGALLAQPLPDGPPLQIAPYNELYVTTGQRHHLNQLASYRDIIDRQRGLSIELEGNILRDAGAPHTLAHRSLEGFWNKYRGTDIVPSNLDYSRALQQSLRAAGLSESQVEQALRAAVRERINAGALGGLEVPRVPRPIRNIAQ